MDLGVACVSSSWQDGKRMKQLRKIYKIAMKMIDKINRLLL
ncbi:hypothetical protein B4096_0767 [Heyndrickxia coagulans]|nr:hypothetical protein B4096_0767 [Heyndrickxia coagulans]